MEDKLIPYIILVGELFNNEYQNKDHSDENYKLWQRLSIRAAHTLGITMEDFEDNTEVMEAMAVLLTFSSKEVADNVPALIGAILMKLGAKDPSLNEHIGFSVEMSVLTLIARGKMTRDKAFQVLRASTAKHDISFMNVIDRLLSIDDLNVRKAEAIPIIKKILGSHLDEDQIDRLINKAMNEII